MTIGVLPFARLKENILANTGFFETSQTNVNAAFAITSGNHDGAGMSHGALQYNFGAADRLTELWLFLLNNHDSVVRSIFGIYTAEYDEFRTVLTTYTRLNKITWGDEKTDYTANAEGRVLKAPWVSIFAALGQTQESKDKYVAMSDVYYFPNPYSLFRQMDTYSKLGLASLYDLVVNKGRYYPINLLQSDFDEIEASENTEDQKEADRIYQINFRGNVDNAVSTPTQPIFWNRRGCMANQGGDYYGTLYDPDVQFDIDQDPALEEKVAHGVKFGIANVNSVFLGSNKIQKIYSGDEIVYTLPYSVLTAPVTQFRNNEGSYIGISGSMSLTAGQKVWIDVTNYVACRTYYTIDGSTPTTASALYNEALTLTTNCVLKTLSVSIYGVAEAVKTITVNVISAPITTISPSTAVQNSIPLTITLSTSEAGATIYYKIGTGAQLTYTAPFLVNQNSAGVASPNIKITYWAVGAGATEAEKSITFDTSGAVPVQPVVVVTNGINQVKLDWVVTANTTSYTIYRSTAAGTLGTVLSSYQAANTFTDLTAVAGTTYYYTVRAGNYSRATDSTQMTGIPTTAAVTSWRYLKIQGYGAAVTGQEITTRMIEVEAWVGATNVLAAGTVLSNDVINAGSTANINAIKDGVKTTVSNTYPIWWVATPNANIVVDLGSQKALTKLTYFGYSVNGDQRPNRFKILASNTNNGADWTTLWDMSINVTVQPILPLGYEKTL